MAFSKHPASAATRIRSREGNAKVDECNVSGSCENGQNPTLRLKVVIRHLPSLLKKSEFCNGMSNYINDQTTDFFGWDQGKIAKDRNKPSTPSRCYVKMKYPVQITGLSGALRAHGIFTDSKGHSTLPQIEFSPFQRIPKQKLRFDPRAGTIEFDSDFQAFLASLNSDVATPAAERVVAGSTHVLALEPHDPAPILANDPMSVPIPLNEPFQKPSSTPLIEYIRRQKAAPERSSLKIKITEKSSAAGNSRSSKRSERRTSERASKPKAKENEKNASEDSKSTEPMALLKRTDSVPDRRIRQVSSGLGSSTTKSAEKLAENTVARHKEVGDKGKLIDRDRQRSSVSGVVAILQRDLGFSGSTRRSRNRATANPSNYEPTTPITSITAVSAPLTTSNLVTTQRMPVSPKRQRGDRPSRRERRAAKLETAGPTASLPSFTTNPALAPSPVVAHAESSGFSTGSPVTMLKKHQFRLTDNSSACSSSNLSPSSETSMNATPHSVLVTAITGTPTGPRGGFRGSRGRNRRGIMIAGNPKPTQPQANLTPTGPAAENGNIAGGAIRGRGRGGQGGARVGPVFVGVRGMGVKEPGSPVSSSLGDSYVNDGATM